MSKYNNKKVFYDGILFDSQYEKDYWVFLKRKEEAGEISNLRRQVPYELIPAVWGEKVVHLKTKDKVVPVCLQKATHYYADFVYTDSEGNEVVVDTKSAYTRTLADYVLKKKMMRAFNGIAIKEIVLGR